MSAVFLSPHHDDETLFGAFTLLREKPLVVVVYDGGPEREAETAAAMEILGCEVEHWALTPDASAEEIAPLIRALPSDLMFAPLWEAEGQPQHNTVAEAAAAARSFVGITAYATYTPAGKTITSNPVAYEPEWVPLKLRALACYPSQAGHASHAPHFIRDQTEYIAV